MAVNRAKWSSAVVRWQREHGRHHLPWQVSRDPYRVWLSEIMLQQTQVTTVLGYYERFLARFDTVEALAAAQPDEVLALWSGLGYYSRARNLHRCAQQVVACYAGQFPSDPEQLMQLPGIGRSTAAAISAFCFRRRSAILDGNVKRVLARVTGFDQDLSQLRHERALWEVAQSLLPASTHMPAYTQGLMDLGATVCTRREPRCEVCPVASHCAALQQGRVHELPLKRRAIRRSKRCSVLLLLKRAGCVWMVRRPETGVWAGLWCLPETPVSLSGATVWDTSTWPGHGRWEQEFEHTLTHVDWTLRPLTWTLPSRMAAAAVRKLTQQISPEVPGSWMTRDQALSASLLAPVRKLLSV